MTTHTPDDPFTPIHQKFTINKGSKYEYEPIPYLDGVSMCAYDQCNAKQIGRYAYTLRESCSLHGLSNMKVLVYPGTICELNGKDHIFAVSGRFIYCPGKVCENYNNPKSFIEITAIANFMQCILSVDRLEAKKGWATPSDVIKLAKNIFGEDIASEIKIFFEII